MSVNLKTAFLTHRHKTPLFRHESNTFWVLDVHLLVGIAHFNTFHTIKIELTSLNASRGRIVYWVTHELRLQAQNKTSNIILKIKLFSRVYMDRNNAATQKTCRVSLVQ